MRLLRLLFVGALLFAPALPVGVAAAAGDAADKKTLPSPGQIIARHVAAIGGREEILKHSSVEMKGRFEFPGKGISGPMEINIGKPAKLFLRVSLVGLGDILSGYDGTNGWSIDPATGPALLSGQRLDQIREQANLHAILHDPKDYQSMETLGIVSFADQPCYQIKLVRQSGRAINEFYEIASGLQLGLATTEQSILGAMAVTSIVSNYKKFSGVLLPTQTSQSMLGMQQLMTLEAVEFDKVPAARFDPPESIKTLIAKPKPAP